MNQSKSSRRAMMALLWLRYKDAIDADHPGGRPAAVAVQIFMTKGNPTGAGLLQYGGCRAEGKKKIDRPTPDYALEGEHQSDRDPSIDIDLQFDTGHRFGIHRGPEINSRLHAEHRPR